MESIEAQPLEEAGTAAISVSTAQTGSFSALPTATSASTAQTGPSASATSCLVQSLER